MDHQFVTIDGGIELGELVQGGKDGLDHESLHGDLDPVTLAERLPDFEQPGGIDVVERGDVGDLRPALGHVGGDGPAQT